MRVYCLETGKRTITSRSLPTIGRMSKKELMRLWPSSALSIRQYTNRHLLDSFILSLSECTENVKQFCAQIEAI